MAARASSDDGSKRDVGFGTTPRGMGFFNNDDTSSSSSSSLTLRSTPLASLAPLFLLADGGLADDIKPSYFASLGLFVLSAPGLWSLVKRSAKSKVDRKTFEVAGPAAEAAMPLDELAREISMFFRRNNYVVADAGEVIVFEGNIAPRRAPRRTSPSASPSASCASGSCAASRCRGVTCGTPWRCSRRSAGATTWRTPGGRSR